MEPIADVASVFEVISQKSTELIPNFRKKRSNNDEYQQYIDDESSSSSDEGTHPHKNEHHHKMKLSNTKYQRIQLSSSPDDTYIINNESITVRQIKPNQSEPYPLSHMISKSNNNSITRYNSKSRRNEILNQCCLSFMKIVCSSWCIVVAWFMFLGILFGAYRSIQVMHEIPIGAAAFIGILAIVLLCSFGCCIICTWLAIDQLRNMKRNCHDITGCCDYIKGTDKDKYYKRQWTRTILEVDKIDYFLQYYGRKFNIVFNERIYEILYEYNGKDYLHALN